MHRIFENLIFNTKSSQIFSTAVRCDCFGAILAIHFTIKGTQSFPLITHLISLPNLSQILSLSLSRSVQQKKGRRRSEDASRKLSFSWVISLVLFLSFSPSLFSLSVTCSKEEEDTKGRRKKKKEKKKEKRKKNKRIKEGK
jgi:hypothetical protein